ncbi:hypothetical protein HDU86_000578 [Geranomyces michiganensis]|nr:hypothetical protein HDU86_000578 [Geranomyces michiganensis]
MNTGAKSVVNSQISSPMNRSQNSPQNGLQNNHSVDPRFQQEQQEQQRMQTAKQEDAPYIHFGTLQHVARTGATKATDTAVDIDTAFYTELVTILSAQVFTEYINIMMKETMNKTPTKINRVPVKADGDTYYKLEYTVTDFYKEQCNRFTHKVQSFAKDKLNVDLKTSFAVKILMHKLEKHGRSEEMIESYVKDISSNVPDTYITNKRGVIAKPKHVKATPNELYELSMHKAEPVATVDLLLILVNHFKNELTLRPTPNPRLFDELRNNEQLRAVYKSFPIRGYRFSVPRVPACTGYFTTIGEGGREIIVGVNLYDEKDSKIWDFDLSAHADILSLPEFNAMKLTHHLTDGHVSNQVKNMFTNV